jgi:hypothetical protein
MSAGSIALATWLVAAPAPTDAPEVPQAPAEAEQPTRIVVILQPDTSEVVRQAVDAAAAQLDRQDVLLQTVPQSRSGSIADKRALAARHDARGVFWFGESDPGRIDVFLATPDAVFVRRVEVDPAAAQASVDATWHIVQSGSSALAMGQRVAMEEVKEEAPPEPEPPPPAEPREPVAPKEGDGTTTDTAPRARVALTAGYLGEGFATAVPWQSGGAIGLIVDAGARARVGLEYGLLAPWSGGSPPIGLRHRVMVHVGVHRGFGARVDLGVRLAAAAEVLHWRGTSGARGVRPMATIGPDATIEIRIVRGLFAYVALGASAVINRFAFVECEDGSDDCSGDRRRVVLAPWWVRPRAHAGLGWRF